MQPLFLLFDPVHLVKNLRNNWQTEKTGTLSFPAKQLDGQDEWYHAQWDHLKQLYYHESDSGNSGRLSLSKLSKASVFPKGIEKQKVSLALDVFSEKTLSALKNSTAARPEWKFTALWISYVIKLWKLFNVKSVYQSVRFNDPDRRPLSNTPEGRKDFKLLIDWAYVAECMAPDDHRTRKQCLTTGRLLGLVSVWLI